MAKRSREVSTSSNPAPHDNDDGSYPIQDPVETNPVHSNKHLELDQTPSSSPAFSSPLLYCTLAPHSTPLPFPSYPLYELHYHQAHTNRCASCLKNFPSPHFLSLHIEENHNPLREILAARGEKTYGCFVEDCERKCSTPQKRRLHLIDKHMFPKSYNFRIIDRGIDGVTSMLVGGGGGPKRRISGIGTRDSPERTIRDLETSSPDRPISRSTPPKRPYPTTSEHQTPLASRPIDEPANTNSDTNTTDDELAAAMSALRFVPKSVQLRRQQQERQQPKT